MKKRPADFFFRQYTASDKGRRWCNSQFRRFLLLACCFFSCRTKSQKVEHVFYRMDTVCRVAITLDQRHAEVDIGRIWTSVDSLLADWHARFSQTGIRSELATLNARTQNCCSLSLPLAEMIHTALRYGDTTRGGFDITVLPIKEAWGLGERDSVPRRPEPDSLARLLSFVNYRKVHLNPSANTLCFASREIRIDLGGVAKGFVIREIDRLLGHLGFSDYLIEAGGDIQCRGLRPDGFPWGIGVRHPRSGKLFAFLTMSGNAIATSGDYERFYIDEESGKRIHHIFNAQTGISCTRNQSVTIASPEAVEADILSTGLFCWEPDSIVAFVEARPRLECIVVDSCGRIYVSRGWAKRIKWKNS